MNSLILYSVRNKVYLLLVVTVILSCKRPQAPADVVVAEQTPPIRAGIKGKVLFREGFFSSSGEILNNGKVYGVERQILFFELTSIRDVEMAESDFIKYMDRELIDSTYSDNHGNFAKELPPGRYSIFVKESRRLYSKPGDGDYFFPVTVFDKPENVIIEIDYKASYMSN